VSLFFVDTNIIAYARDRRSPDKQPVAGAWLADLARRKAGRISSQVLIEYYSVAVHSRKLALAEEAARADIRALLAWNPIAPDAALFEVAWQVQDRYDFSWWDALIVAAALRQGCGTLLSEDLQHGLSVDVLPRGNSLVIINPFASDAPLPGRGFHQP
jgi:predicted nucleic acid-binding protein